MNFDSIKSFISNYKAAIYIALLFIAILVIAFFAVPAEKAEAAEAKPACPEQYICIEKSAVMLPDYEAAMHEVFSHRASLEEFVKAIRFMEGIIPDFDEKPIMLTSPNLLEDGLYDAIRNSGVEYYQGSDEILAVFEPQVTSEGHISCDSEAIKVVDRVNKDKLAVATLCR